MQLAQGPEKRAFQLALWLAFFNQACGSTAIIIYAPEYLMGAGAKTAAKSLLLSSAINASKARACDGLH